MRKVKPSKKTKLKISACYIVKNESKNLPRSLESLKNIVDEIIVVDTGSTDNTIEIAESYNAKVIETPWQDDFSTPRNLAIENASGDYIIFLDADEYFSTPNKVRSYIEKNANVDAIFVMRIDIDEDDNNKEVNRDYYLRIFKNVDYLRYRGLIHENVERLDGGNMSMVFDEKDLIVYHTGYSANIGESKLYRNLKLIELERQKYGEKDQHNIALADCYFALKDYEKVVHFAQKALHAKLKPITGLSGLYRKMLIAMRTLNYPVDEILQATDDAIRDVPDTPVFYAEKGLILYALNQYEESYKNLTAALNIWNKKSMADKELPLKNLVQNFYAKFK